MHICGDAFVVLIVLLDAVDLDRQQYGYPQIIKPVGQVHCL